MPDNHALEGLAGGLVAAWKIYNRKESINCYYCTSIKNNFCDFVVILRTHPVLD
jgi:hypothetical protein